MRFPRSLQSALLSASRDPHSTWIFSDTFNATLMSGSVQRAAEVSISLEEIQARVEAASAGSSRPPTLVAVSKLKPAADILTCHEDGHLDFGENYVQELAEKAAALPADIRWHFIGTLQSNKAKTLASIPNLHTVQTLTSVKTANILNDALPADRVSPLNIFIQINTSSEGTKSGLPPLTAWSDVANSGVVQLAKSIITECPKLRLQGLMTIGALRRSINASQMEQNIDFERLKETRELLHGILKSTFGESAQSRWGEDNRLLLSMGMSSDFEVALKAGSDVVRVGTGIFGERPKKTDEN
ncbi:hypothetical protein D9615_009111 [Tricholomella constricta]|uniref:Pyridoxal phosphate homeostasis protein n=1 Tax=Tricholomella constricta TaxID=117010 RepID=A0A8H5LYY1_9AGAR|nr:hypothetical protein D9615_009111 [Tricholomella constricta]